MTPEKIRPKSRLGAHEGRLSGDYADDEVTYFYGPLVERMRPLFGPVMQYNKAHVVMLAEQGIVERERATPLLKALLDLDREGIDDVELDPTLQGIYPNIEALIIDRTGSNVGGMLYLGRTRGDAQLIPVRMAHRDGLLDVLHEVLEMWRATLDLAGRHLETIMPCYTHLQHAQPMTFGFYLLWFAEALQSDAERLMDAFRRSNRSPAEIGVGMMTGFPIDRHRVAALLGFDGLIENGLFAHRGLDREIENLNLLSLVALDMYRLCEDFLVWCASDVRFMELADSYSATSFMMAQKKNPAALQHIENAAVVTHGAALRMHDIAMRNTSEVILKGSEAILAFQDSLRSVLGAARLLKGLIPSVVVHPERMRASMASTFLSGTELADTLVREAGLSFREAHRVVGIFVRLAVERSLTMDQTDTDMLDQAAQEALGKPLHVPAETLAQALDPMTGVEARTTFGGVAPSAAREAIERQREKLAEGESWLGQQRQALVQAQEQLERACAALAPA